MRNDSRLREIAANLHKRLSVETSEILQQRENYLNALTARLNQDDGDAVKWVPADQNAALLKFVDAIAMVERTATLYVKGNLTAFTAAKKFEEALPLLGYMTFLMELDPKPRIPDILGQPVKTFLIGRAENNSKATLESLRSMIDACKRIRDHDSLQMGPYFDVMDEALQFVEYQKELAAQQQRGA